jgi:hypothetical protein
MAPINNINNNPGIIDTLTRCNESFEAADLTVFPGDKSSMSNALLACFGQTDIAVDGYNQSNLYDLSLEDVEVAKNLADDSFYDAKQNLVASNHTFIKTREVDYASMDSVASDYLTGTHAYTQLCGGGNISGLIDRWNLVNSDNQVNCGQLLTSQNEIKRIASISFTPVTANTNRFSKFASWLKDTTHITPFTYYTSFAERGGAGVGVGVEVLAPITNAPLAVGLELQAITYPTFDDPNIFSGEIKTWETFINPPLLEFGYQGEKATAVVQGGFWFTNYHLFKPRAATNPYSENIFDNPQYQVGIKTYLVNNRLMLSAGYQHSPWGPGGYGAIGYTFGGKEQ